MSHPVSHTSIQSELTLCISPVLHKAETTDRHQYPHLIILMRLQNLRNQPQNNFGPEELVIHSA